MPDPSVARLAQVRRGLFLSCVNFRLPELDACVEGT